MKIEVTPEDIALGDRENEICCPVALAIKRACAPKNPDVAVFDREVQLNGRKFPLPQEAQDFIGDFDDGEDPSPFSFELPLESLLEEKP